MMVIIQRRGGKRMERKQNYWTQALEVDEQNFVDK